MQGMSGVAGRGYDGQAGSGESYSPSESTFFETIIAVAGKRRLEFGRGTVIDSLSGK